MESSDFCWCEDSAGFSDDEGAGGTGWEDEGSSDEGTGGGGG